MCAMLGAGPAGIGRIVAVNLPAIEASATAAMQPFVFISHSSQDRRIAARVCEALERCGLACWHASRDIGPGENFQEEIVKAIRSARAMVLVFTGSANNSDEIKKEIALASQHHLPSFRSALRTCCRVTLSVTSFPPGNGSTHSTTGTGRWPVSPSRSARLPARKRPHRLRRQPRRHIPGAGDRFCSRRQRSS